MKTNYHTSKLYQTDLYDHVKKLGNHIICLGNEQAKTFILLAAIRHRAYQAYDNYGGYKTLIVEPDSEHAALRTRILTDHTELKVVNIFPGATWNYQDTQAFIAPMDYMHDCWLPTRYNISLVVLDFAHLIMLNHLELVEQFVNRYPNVQILALMCSLTQNSDELDPSCAIGLIRKLELILKAKCETSSDLRSLSRQSTVTSLEIIEFQPSELVICDWVLLADSLMKQFCDLILDSSLDDVKPLIKPDTDLDDDTPTKQPSLNVKKQLVIVKSCLSDIIYAMHCLGPWCAKKTIQLYLTEFSRLLQMEQHVGDLIAAASTILNTYFSRIEEIMGLFPENDEDIVLRGSSKQLRALLDCISDFKPTTSSSWPICIVHVRRRVIAKVMALWLDKVSRSNEQYSFIKPNYIVGSSRKHRNRMAVDNFDLHHEASVRDFRFGNCNVLVSSAASERCTDIPRCNLVVSFDIPVNFADFIQAKGNCRYDSSKYVIMSNRLLEQSGMERLSNYLKLERVLNNMSSKIPPLDIDEPSLLEAIETQYDPYPNEGSKNPATIRRSINIINKYCTKLPSDSFTKLSPEWNTNETDSPEGGEKMYYCDIRLPINSPVRQKIIGPKAPSKSIAMRLAAFMACKVLHRAGELDDNMMPVTKESMKTINPSGGSREPSRPRQRIGTGTSKTQSVGSTKHRQYYKKRIAKVFSGPLVVSKTQCFLYRFTMKLTCPIPDEQNRRGRRIIYPESSGQNFGILCTSRLPKICAFPVFTRSGEVTITLDLIDSNPNLDQSELKYLKVFHEFTFSKVLRLQKYPTIFDPDNSPIKVLLAPIIETDSTGEGDKVTRIDWDFLHKIVSSNIENQVPSLEERMSYKFEQHKYWDAVVIPWYRLTDRQQFAYYVADACWDLNPDSPFPDKSSGFKTFVDYYKSKYDIEIFDKQQPVLDVDHTSARLNLLTPRYVNRKGRTLPSSTAKTRKESRESLAQKQLLIPELCSIHPFPASLWRKAVCLPCIFYRLNSLFLAEELRRQVAEDTGVGFVDPPEDFEWPPLDFGWSLKDVINGQGNDESQSNDSASGSRSKTKASAKAKRRIASGGKVASIQQPIGRQMAGDEIKAGTSAITDEGDFVIDHFDPSKYDIPDIPLDAPNEWMNIKLITSSSDNTGAGAPSGWDQPLEQRDLILEYSNESNWSDCDIDTDGDIESVDQLSGGQMRCGSPSNFEPSRYLQEEMPSLRAPTFAISSGLGKSVKFGARDNNDETFEDTDSDAKRSSNPKLERSSEDSWSMSDDDDFDFDDLADSGNSDEETAVKPLYGEWKDSKLKNRPLMRELFLPAIRNTLNKSQMNDGFKIQSLYRKIIEHQLEEVGTHEEGFESIDVLGDAQTLIIREVADGPDQRLADILNKILDNHPVISDAEINGSLVNWYGTLRRLTEGVERTLINTPDIFHDNEFEVVTVDDSFNHYNLEMQPTFGELLPNRDSDSNWSSEEWKNIKFDPTKSEIKSKGPGPSIILQALTMSNASDGINLERLETVGDSFLKYSITAYFYCMYPSMHEGKLSYLRSTEISNANLYQLGKSKHLGELMSATKFEPNDNWLPPCYAVAPDSGSVDPLESDSATNPEPPVGSSIKRREIDKALAEVPYDLLLQHSIPDKSIADCVEALIGAYLTASGSRAALLFMQWLGLKVIPPTFDLEAEKTAARGLSDEEGKLMWRWLDSPPSPLICVPPSIEGNEIPVDRQHLETNAYLDMEKLYYGYSLSKFEEEIGYSFKDKAYIVQAFTHNSYYENHVTDCHQRLEFLGDALLDYLITRYLFEDPRCHSPGTLTDLRSALVNNTFFASLAVKYKFHKYLMYISDELFHVINNFVKKFNFDSKDTITKGYTLLISEGESEYAEDIEVPKALGDVFESVAGAIYLDSGMSLDQVWQVYFKMMKPEIEYFSSNVPKSPIRELLESMPQNVRFSPSELAPDRKHRVIAEVFGLGRFTGVGRNKHSAKSTAAKRALRMLALRDKELEAKEKMEQQAAKTD